MGRGLVRDATELTLHEPMDAVIGRLVLMYFADPAVLLRRLAANLKPGGIVAFQEIDPDGAKTEPECPTFTITMQRIKQTFARAGIDYRTGLKLGPIFAEAGLPAPQLILGARVEHGPASPIYDQLAQIARTLLPIMERTGVATAAEIGIETLAEWLRAEAVALNATLVTPSFIGAWARKGTAS